MSSRAAEPARPDTGGGPRPLCGQCHCGALGFELTLSKPRAAWRVRSCDCSFCSAHGAVYLSDPDATLAFRWADASCVGRYRFGLRTADFVFCRRCGSLLGAVMPWHGTAYAVINANLLDAFPDGLVPRETLHFGEETAEARYHRRASQWTPVVRDLPVAPG